VTRLNNTPALFLEPPTVAVSAAQSMASSWADEVVLSILKEEGGLPVVRMYGTPEALGALASAIGEALDLLPLVPLDEDHRRQVDVVRDVKREPSDE